MVSQRERAVYVQVYERDLWMTWRTIGSIPWEMWRAASALFSTASKLIVCVAPLVSPESGPCWGRTTFDHIKSQQRLAKRAETDLDHLVSVCQGHMEDGRKAGHQWNTAHRPEIREYIKEANEDYRKWLVSNRD